MCGSRRNESKISGYKPGNLHRIPDYDRKAAKDFAPQKQV
jgi:hypothetical protein